MRLYSVLDFGYLYYSVITLVLRGFGVALFLEHLTEQEMCSRQRLYVEQQSTSALGDQLHCQLKVTTKKVRRTEGLSYSSTAEQRHLYSSLMSCKCVFMLPTPVESEREL